jgi:hypothetical protein
MNHRDDMAGDVGPYEYVLKGLAEDFWSILKKEGGGYRYV